MKRTALLTGFSTQFYGSAKRSEQAIIAQKRQSLLEGTLDYQTQFIDEITPELLDKHSKTERCCHYPDRVTFWAFFSQVISDDASCAAAVARVQCWAQQKGLPIPSKNTGAYCQARADLPLSLLKAVNESLLGQLNAQLPTHSHWRGLRPRAEDGTSAQMPDTASNREKYPYPHGQSEGCGFPMVRLGGLVDLSHGGMCEFASCDMNTSELSNHYELESNLQLGDLFIGDRLYSNYELIVRLHSKGVHFAGRTHQARKIDFRKGKRIGPNQLFGSLA